MTASGNGRIFVSTDKASKSICDDCFSTDKKARWQSHYVPFNGFWDAELHNTTVITRLCTWRDFEIAANTSLSEARPLD